MVLEEYVTRVNLKYRRAKLEEKEHQKKSIGLGLACGLSGKAWKAVRHLVKDEESLAKLEVHEGHKL